VPAPTSLRALYRTLWLNTFYRAQCKCTSMRQLSAAAATHVDVWVCRLAMSVVERKMVLSLSVDERKTLASVSNDGER
jgi:hypothetical protein